MNGDRYVRCLNCNAAVTFQNLYCSTTCAEMDRRNQAAKKALDERLAVGQVSVLSVEDRAAIADARRWLRYIWQQGFTIKLDALEHDGLEEAMRNLDAMAVKLYNEPQLANSNIGGNGGR